MAVESRNAVEKGGEFSGGVGVERNRASPAKSTNVKAQSMLKMA
jgi:hypothetical protein